MKPTTEHYHPFWDDGILNAKKYKPDKFEKRADRKKFYRNYFKTIDEINMEELELDSRNERYIVDVRNGCIALIDTHHPRYEDPSPGLNRNLPYVVYFILGRAVYDENDKFKKWVIDEPYVLAMKAVASTLNNLYSLYRNDTSIDANITGLDFDNFDDNYSSFNKFIENLIKKLKKNDS